MNKTKTKTQTPTKTFGNFVLPKNAFIPETDLWFELIIEGDWTPGNTGKPEKWDEKRMLSIVEATKEQIIKKDFPPINRDHSRFGQIGGLLSDVRYNHTRKAIEGRVAYLTPDLREEINQGKWPYRSVEINRLDGREYVSGVAMVGYPAVKGMELNNMNLSETEFANQLLYINYKEANNMADKAKDNQTHLEFTDTPEYQEYLELKKLEKEFEEVQNLKKEADKEKADLLKQFAAHKQDLENELQSYKTDLQKLKIETSKKEIKSQLEKHPVAGYSVDVLTELVYSVQETEKDTVLTFSEGKEEQKIQPSKMVLGLIESYSKLFNRLKTNEIEVKEDLKPDQIYYSSESETDIVKMASDYAEENKISLMQAYEELRKKGKIVV